MDATAASCAARDEAYAQLRAYDVEVAANRNEPTGLTELRETPEMFDLWMRCQVCATLCMRAPIYCLPKPSTARQEQKRRLTCFRTGARRCSALGCGFQRFPCPTLS